MNVEIEAKFLDINQVTLRQTLTKLGASLIHREYLMKREIFDYPDLKLEKIGGWVRVRDEGDKITLSYKQLENRGLAGTKETNLIVDDFKKACDFLTSIGLKSKSFQETKREKWILEETEITIDTWPWLPTFVEIEGPSEEKVKKISADLGFDWADALHGSVENIYMKYYDVTEQEIDRLDRITFSDKPGCLKPRSKD